MRYEENILPDDASFLRLYNDAGWTAYTSDPASLREALEHSLYVLCVYDHSDQLVGLLRAVGDGVTILYIQDVLVLSTHRRQGIGTALVSHTLGRFRNVRQRVLTSDDTPELRVFYARQGFVPYNDTGLVAYYFMG